VSELLAGTARVLGGLLIALGMLAIVVVAYWGVAYGILVLFRYVPLTGRHKNTDLPSRNRDAETRNSTKTRP
jgi:hypothetical protein